MSIVTNKRREKKKKQQVPAHVVRFYHPDNVATVHHMSFNPETSRLAVLKRLQHEDKSSGYSIVEVWAVGRSRIPVVLKRMFVDNEQHSLLENVVWGNESRLFSCGHNSCLNEHDVGRNAIKESVTVGGGVVWCMAVDSSRNNIATGSEDGTVSVFAIEGPESISFGKVVGKCATRVLSIAWTGADSGRSRIIAGSIDFITIWSYRKSTCLDKLDVKQGNVPPGETIIWSLTVWGDYLISGDSKGFTSFWDLKQRVNVKSVQSHEADVLTVTADSTGRVYSAGVDPKISCFKVHDHVVDLVHEHKVNQHDVRSIVVGPENELMSAGNGTYFVQFKRKFDAKKTSLSFLDFHSNIRVAGSSVLFNYHKSLELYELSQTAEPVKLLAVSSKTCILSSAFSDSFVVYRTADKMCILKRSPDYTSVQKIAHTFEEPVLSIDHLLLSGDSLLIVCGDTVWIMQLPEGVVRSPIILSGTVYHCFSIGGGRIVFVQIGGRMTALDLNSLQLIEMQPMENHVVDHGVSRDDTDSFWLLMANKVMLSYKLSAPMISSSASVGLHNRHINWQGMTMIRSSLLLYSSDFILCLGKEKYTLRNTSGAYKHIVKVSECDRAVVIVVIPDQELQTILPAKFDGKSTQSFIK